MIGRALGLLLLAASFGCSDSLTGPSKTVALGRAFDLRVAESALVRDELLAVTFDGVTSDSRCPLGVVCIQAGDAVLRVTARRLPKTESSLTLHSELARGSATFQGFVIALVELAPYPKAGERIRASDYVATLKITRP